MRGEWLLLQILCVFQRTLPSVPLGFLFFKYTVRTRDCYLEVSSNHDAKEMPLASLLEMQISGSVPNLLNWTFLKHTGYSNMFGTLMLGWPIYVMLVAAFAYDMRIISHDFPALWGLT